MGDEKDHSDIDYPASDWVQTKADYPGEGPVPGLSTLAILMMEGQ